MMGLIKYGQAVVGTTLMAIPGVLFGNDYAIFWLIILPTVLGMGAAISRSQGGGKLHWQAES